jgi:hypothetical protein
LPVFRQIVLDFLNPRRENLRFSSDELLTLMRRDFYLVALTAEKFQVEVKSKNLNPFSLVIQK